MKKNVLTSVTVSLAAAAMISGTAMAAEYKVGIIQFVDECIPESDRAEYRKGADRKV